MNMHVETQFSQPGMIVLLEAMDEAALNALEFGVIGFGRDGKVRRYNSFESKAAGLGVERVLGQDLFMVVALCMNNFLVAQRFADAHESGEHLDDIISYVLTLRMRPTKVKLRLLSDPASELSYVLVHRL